MPLMFLFFPNKFFPPFRIETAIKKAELTKGIFLRQLGHTGLFGTRRFPPPSYGGFSFVGKSIFH
jgi:hypothetical protein